MEDTGLAIAVAAAALVAVFLLNRRSEQQTAMQIAQIAKAKAFDPNAPLSIGDQIAIGATIVTSIYGSPAAGAKVAGLLAPR